MIKKYGQSSPQSQRIVLRNKPIQRGIKNAGNTCFLNSVLQQILRIKSVQKCINGYKYRPKRTLICYLKYLEMLLRLKNPAKYPQSKIKVQIQICIFNIVQKLEQQFDHYKKKNQFDSLEVFFYIFDVLLQFFPSLKQQFEISFQLKCQCLKNSNVFYDFSIDMNKKICKKCNKVIQIKLCKQSQYLILIGMQSLQDFKDQNYKIQSLNIYRGNGEKGHYMSIIQNADKYYLYNDQTVIIKQNMEECLKNVIRFAIYQKKEFKQAKIQRNSNELQQFQPIAQQKILKKDEIGKANLIKYIIIVVFVTIIVIFMMRRSKEKTYAQEISKLNDCFKSLIKEQQQDNNNIQSPAQNKKNRYRKRLQQLDN